MNNVHPALVAVSTLIEQPPKKKNIPQKNVEHVATISYKFISSLADWEKSMWCDRDAITNVMRHTRFVIRFKFHCWIATCYFVRCGILLLNYISNCHFPLNNSFSPWINWSKRIGSRIDPVLSTPAGSGGGTLLPYAVRLTRYRC